MFMLGQVIGTVGPKNVYNIKNNPYKDENGNPTNGATTGCHLHLTIKENKIAVDPLNYFNYMSSSSLLLSSLFIPNSSS